MYFSNIGDFMSVEFVTSVLRSFLTYHQCFINIHILICGVDVKNHLQDR